MHTVPIIGLNGVKKAGAACQMCVIELEEHLQPRQFRFSLFVRFPIRVVKHLFSDVPTGGLFFEQIVIIRRRFSCKPERVHYERLEMIMMTFGKFDMTSPILK